MRISFLLMSIVFLANFLNAQVKGGYNDKLAKLYIDGKYESCLFKADNLTYKEGSSNDPEPYLYIAMCFYQLSKSDDPLIQEDYKDGLRQAIKYTSKFAKKDKEGEMYQNNIEFINLLKGIQYQSIKSEFDQEDYRKAAIAAKNYDKLNREQDYLILYFVGACEIMSKNLSQGNTDIDLAKEQLILLVKSNGVKVDKMMQGMFSQIFTKYSEYLIAQNEIQAAATELELGLKLLPNDGFLKIQSNMVAKKLESPKK